MFAAKSQMRQYINAMEERVRQTCPKHEQVQTEA